MNNPFSKFENFGSITDYAKRKELAKAIYVQLQKKSGEGIGISNSDTEHFTTSIDEILLNPEMKELCFRDPELAQKITQDILDFVNNTKKQIIKMDNPLANEIQLFNEGNEIKKTEFIEYFEKASLFLEDNYKKEDLDITFYIEQFKSCFFEAEWDDQLKNHEGVIDIELNLINKFQKINAREKDFFSAWKEALNFLTKTYKRRDIDCNNYFSIFREALNQNKDSKNESFSNVKESFISSWKQIRKKRIIKEENKQKLNSEKNIEIKSRIEKTKNEKYLAIKEHFLEKWERLQKEKRIKWELDHIEQERKKFCKDLYKRIVALKKLQEVLEPFTNELGRLWDMSNVNWQKVNFDILKRYAELLQRDRSLKELAEMLGRTRQAEKEFEDELFTNIQIKSDWKVEHASKADLIGVHESDDLSSLLPSETAWLADETMQSVFFKKFAEKKLQTFEYQAKMLSCREEEFLDKRQKEKAEEKGPFIICVDTSGSMHGAPESIAKTLCFAILKMAIRDNRKCYLISFSTGIETLNLTDLKNSLERIIEFLLMSFHGGTDAAPAMREALRQLQSNDYKKADVLMISDFVMPSFDKQSQEQIKTAKESKTKFHSLVVGSSQNQNVIADFDNNWFYNPDRQDSILTLVKNLNGL